jgi:DNA replication protein DnaC
MAQKQDLIVLDELGFISFTPKGAHALITFCSKLYERTALILTTNLLFANRVELFGDESLTATLLDRLTHHAHIIELTGESFRFRQRKKVREN